MLVRRASELLAVVTLVHLSAVGTAAARPDNLVAKVGKTPITQFERVREAQRDLPMASIAFHGGISPEKLKKARADAYERLILETMIGNQSLFIRRDEVERSWTWIDSILEAWKNSNEPPKPYPAGSWGPVASVALLARDDREWEE